MKKIFFVVLLLGGCILTGCTVKHPCTNLTFIDMQVGEFATVEVYNTDESTFEMQSETNNISPTQEGAVCSIEILEEGKVKVNALRAGRDTLVVSYQYHAGIHAYADFSSIPICVTE